MAWAVRRDSVFGRHVIQTWSRAAIVSWIVVALGTTGARLTPLVRTVEAGQCSGHTTLSLTVATDAAPACRHSDAVQAAHGGGADDAILARHRRLRIKRFRRRFAGLPRSAAFRNELRVAGIAGALQIANLDPPAPSRDHARAPPSSNHPA
jgi:hypothetical protein